MGSERYRQRVLDTHLYYFKDPVEHKRFVIQQETVQIQDMPSEVNSELALRNPRNTQVTVELQLPVLQSESWWGCCSQQSHQLQKIESEKDQIKVHPYISPLRLGMREKKPWTTFKDQIVVKGQNNSLFFE